jgi:hypothetical protein
MKDDISCIMKDRDRCKDLIDPSLRVAKRKAPPLREMPI